MNETIYTKKKRKEENTKVTGSSVCGMLLWLVNSREVLEEVTVCPADPQGRPVTQREP